VVHWELHQRQRQEELEQEVAAVEAVAWEAEALAAAQVEEEEEEDDNDDFDWFDDDGPDPEEQAAQQWAIVESFESQKKVQDNTGVREEDSDVRVHHRVDDATRIPCPRSLFETTKSFIKFAYVRGVREFSKHGGCFMYTYSSRTP
jgi:hypothetical protein